MYKLEVLVIDIYVTSIWMQKAGVFNLGKNENHKAAQTYRIGAVSRLTGIAPDTLRVWERRYDAVTPFRTDAGSRLYSQEDVGRLALIKRLVDGGDAISRVANLSMEQLEERVKGTPLPEFEVSLNRPCRIVVLGSSRIERLQLEMMEDQEIEFVGCYRDQETFLSRAPKLDADVVVFEYKTIQPEQIREIGMLLLRSGADRALVVYSVAARPTLNRLESSRIIPIRSPINSVMLRRCCMALQARKVTQPSFKAEYGIEITRPLPERRYDDATLAKIAAASVTVRCECPHHLVDIISSLAAFEAYSEECEVLNVDDAALHTFLHSATAQARAMLETALASVVESENIL